jgi:hypothetical protein
MTQSYLGAYWGPRAQSVDECANLVTELITRVAGIDPSPDRLALRSQFETQGHGPTGRHHC